MVTHTFLPFNNEQPRKYRQCRFSPLFFPPLDSREARLGGFRYLPTSSVHYCR
jgi:hypothetical protein